MAKTRIIDELGESALLLPEQVNQGLVANDRVKYLFTLLQAAREHAERPGEAFPDLSRERAATDLDGSSLEDGARRSSRRHDGYLIPGAADIVALIERSIREMLRPLGERESAGYAARLGAVLDSLPPLDGDLVAPEFIPAATSARRDGADSLHVMVMDLHKALNRLQAGIAEEVVDGARAYGLGDTDRARVRAFMAGLNRTAPLKFDHPGLDTTATRTGARLVIQNDIGTTDAHVLVVHVVGRSVTVTYTDIHMRRARFFQSLFRNRGMTWEDTRSRSASGFEESDSYLLCTGTFDAADEAALEEQLGFIGSRLVFLIDWNKARKRLRQFVRNADAIDLLRWAADNQYGHRAFLELGGEQLINETIQHAFSSGVPYGQRLDSILDRDSVREYLRRVLQASSESLRAGRSKRLVRDELKAELFSHVQGEARGLLNLLGDHVAISVDLAHGVHDALRDCRNGGTAVAARVAQRAKRWETRADDLLIRVRENTAHHGARLAYARICERADEVTDQLEEAAFLVSMLPDITLADELSDCLESLSGLAVTGTHRLAAAVAALHDLERAASREDLHDFLESVDDLIDTEHRTDEAEREVVRGLVRNAPSALDVHVVSLLARRFEKTGDALARTAFLLRDHVMGEVARA